MTATSTQSKTAMPSIPPPVSDGKMRPLAVDAKQLAKLLSVSVRTIRMLDMSGKLPRPVRVGGRSVRWIVAEVEGWLAADTPDRATWQAIRREKHG